MGNNALIIATEIGSVSLTTIKNGKLRHIMLTNVLYAPDLGTNLLSVSKMNEKGYNVLFSRQGYATILDEHDNWLGSAFKKNGLYCLATKNQPLTTGIMHVMANPRFALSSTSCEKPLPIQTWHQRLGHLNYSSVKALSHLADGIRISESPHDQELCIACLEGKFRQTYRKQPSN